MKYFISILSLIFFFYGSSECNAQNIWYVDSLSAGSKDGTSWGNATNNLQAAIDLAFKNGGGQVWVKHGTYICNKLVMKKKVRLYGGFSGSESFLNQRNWKNYKSILSGKGTNAIIYNNYTFADQLDTTAMINGFTIANGANSARGTVYASAIFNNYASPSILNCIITKNSSFSWGVSTAAYGGAVYNNRSAPVIINCDFTLNTVRDGNTSFAHGGAIHNRHSSPTIANCNFVSNTSPIFGGAIYNYNSSVKITNCTFESNAGFNFGGAICSQNSNLWLSDCLFSNNSAQLNHAGAVAFENTTSSITNCKFISNSCDRFGGAIYATGDYWLNISQCEFFGNSSEIGGAFFFNRTKSRIDNSLFSKNFTKHNSSSYTPGEKGGALFLTNSSPQITNSTLVYNNGDLGGAIFCDANSSPALTNCILFGNTSNLQGQIYINQINCKPKLNFCLNQCNCIESINGLDYVLADYLNNLDALPQFVDASQNDYHLGYGSPCINSGSPDTTGLHLPPSDLDDKPRVFNNRIDMGCYESDGITALFPELTDYDNNGPNIFPNPTSGKINIKGFDNIKIEQICVMTFSGMIIEQIMVDSFNGSVSIDLSDKPKGLYFVKIKTCNGIITEKVILK